MKYFIPIFCLLLTIIPTISSSSTLDIDHQTAVVGDNHACAIDTNYQIHCWGDATQGQLDVPKGIVTPLALSAGSSHTCALYQMNGLKKKNQIKCWGNVFGGWTIEMVEIWENSPDFSDLKNPIAIDSWKMGSCVVDQGSEIVDCRGYITDWGTKDDRGRKIRFTNKDLYYPDTIDIAIVQDDLRRGFYSYHVCILSKSKGVFCDKFTRAGGDWQKFEWKWSGNITHYREIPNPIKFSSGDNLLCTFNDDPNIPYFCTEFYEKRTRSLSTEIFNPVDIVVWNENFCILDSGNSLVCENDKIVPEKIRLYHPKILVEGGNPCFLDNKGRLICWDKEGNFDESPPGIKIKLDSKFPGTFYAILNIITKYIPPHKIQFFNAYIKILADHNIETSIESKLTPLQIFSLLALRPIVEDLSSSNSRDKILPTYQSLVLQYIPEKEGISNLKDLKTNANINYLALQLIQAALSSSRNSVTGQTQQAKLELLISTVGESLAHLKIGIDEQIRRQPLIDAIENAVSMGDDYFSNHTDLVDIRTSVERLNNVFAGLQDILDLHKKFINPFCQTFQAHQDLLQQITNTTQTHGFGLMIQNLIEYLEGK